jgi:hypothetical protein
VYVYGIEPAIVGPDPPEVVVKILSAFLFVLFLSSFSAAGPEWKEYAVTFEELGLDGSDVMMIFFGAVNDPGPFTLWIDQIRLK